MVHHANREDCALSVQLLRFICHHSSHMPYDMFSPRDVYTNGMAVLTLNRLFLSFKLYLFPETISYNYTE